MLGNLAKGTGASINMSGVSISHHEATPEPKALTPEKFSIATRARLGGAGRPQRTCLASLPNQQVLRKLNNFFEGTIEIPEIQRDLVWSSDQVKSLLDSIYQSYPSRLSEKWAERVASSALTNH